ncbi:MAG: ABC transporter substrate-binding protein [Chloroflexota bacterium]
MNHPQLSRFLSAASAGRLSRRQVVERGLALGVATPLLERLWQAAPVASAPSAPAPSPARRRAQEGGSGSFTALISVGTEDIDPHYSYATLSSTIAYLAYEMLVRYKDASTDEFEGMLARSWEISEDQSTYTFTLHDNVLFHDGTPCDAQAVKTAYTRWIELGGAPVLVIARFVETPDMMEVVDPVTLRFNLGKPQPLFLSAMASQYGPSVISPAAIEANRTDDDPYAHEFFKMEAVGTGPYRLTTNSISEGLILDKFEEFHLGWEGNHFDQVIFRVVPEDGTRRQLLEQGQADASAYNLTLDSVEALRSNPDLTVVEYPTTAVSWAILNAPRLGGVEARQGLCYAFPYDEVQNAVYRGLLKRTGPLADTVKGYDPDVFIYPTDLARAKDLLAAGGFPEGSVIECMFDANDERESTICQLFQASLAEIGISLELIAVDYATVESTIFGDQPAGEKPHIIAGWGWWPDYNDPWNHLAPNFTAANIGNGGSNAGAWENARFEEIMAEAEVFETEEQLDGLMKEAQNILTEQDPPCIFYGQVVRYNVIRKEIQGFEANPLYLDAFNVWEMSRG